MESTETTVDIIEHNIETWEVKDEVLRLYVHAWGTLVLDVTVFEPFNTPWDRTKAIKLKLEVPRAKPR